MQLLIKIANGSPVGEPVTADNLRQVNHDLPAHYLRTDDLQGTGFAGFITAPQPSNKNPLLHVVEVLPQERNHDGEWIQRWQIVPRDDLDDDERRALNESYLAHRKAALCALVNTERDSREMLPFTYLGRPFDSDERSVKRILTAAQAAQAAMAAVQEFSIEWMCADNTSIELDGQQMQGMPGAMAAHAYALHRYGREIKEIINAATALEDLEGIDIASGWPNSGAVL